MVIEDLKLNNAKTGFNEGTDFILNGGSAGGIGTFLNFPWIRENLPASFTRKAAVPIAGWYNFVVDDSFNNAVVVDGDDGQIPDFRNKPDTFQFYYSSKLWNSWVPEDCKTRNPENPWDCLLSRENYKDIEGDLFMVQSQVDSVQLKLHNGVPKPAEDNPQNYLKSPANSTTGTPSDLTTPQYIQQWRQLEAKGLDAAVDANKAHRVGYFFANCFIHEGTFTHKNPLLDDGNGGKKSFMDVMNEWYSSSPGDTTILSDKGALDDPGKYETLFQTAECPQNDFSPPVTTPSPPGKSKRQFVIGYASCHVLLLLLWLPALVIF